MNITWYGDTTFIIENDKTKIVVDPQGQQADAIVYTQEKNTLSEKNAFDLPGEYEIGGIGWIGIPYDTAAEKKSMMTLFDVEHIKVCHLGHLNINLEEEQLKEIGDVDVLLVPLGEKDTLTVKKAASLIEKIEPRIIIPMLYNEGSLDELKQEMSIKETEPQKVFKIKKASLPTDEAVYVILEKTS